MKGIADETAAVGKKIEDDDLFGYILIESMRITTYLSHP